MMWDGKKATATMVLYDALDIIGKKVKDTPPLEVFEDAVQNCKPNVEVRSKRVGGSNYQVPMPVNRKRQLSLAIRWIREAARSKKGMPIARSLAQELMDAYRGEGTAITTRNNVHRMAEANKAFAHFAW
jgi:small subunit ribosomal protein S7